jgi:uncharacterized repeat protein (TIGR03803 family)
MTRVVSEFGKLNWAKRAWAVFVLCAMTVIALPAQTFTSLFSFDGAYGIEPFGALVQATNGDLYGTTLYGGVNCTQSQAGSCGTVFKITPSGTLTTLYSFCSKGVYPDCTDGNASRGGLIQATNGDLYGTTGFGGAYGGGTIFRMTPSGMLTTLYSFCSLSSCADGSGPNGLVQATNGDLYGTTSGGGINGNYGTVFKITPSGTLATLYNFCSQANCADGDYPSVLVQATSGDFYGTTGGVGAYRYNGTVFKITPSGTLTTLYTFCTDSSCEYATELDGLIQAADGDLYGTTSEGGDGINGAGTVFRITPRGALRTLHNFSCSPKYCPDGGHPPGALVQATDGNLYGTTLQGGANGEGTVFQITPSGTLTALYSFCAQTNCADGATPIAGLVQATNGDFYGTTSIGGSSSACGEPGCGTVFSLSLGLDPFVKTLPIAGVVGEAVRILGYELTGATSVTFNGIPATFTVVSSTEITTTVPTGATTGSVQVVTPSGMLSSNVSFGVVP